MMDYARLHFATRAGPFVADYFNSTIRKIRPSGTNWIVTTIAGKVGVTDSADGIGTNAVFD